MAYGNFSEISRSRVFEEIAVSIVFTGFPFILLGIFKKEKKEKKWKRKRRREEESAGGIHSAHSPRLSWASLRPLQMASL
jgi:hypothetical protein